MPFLLARRGNPLAISVGRFDYFLDRSLLDGHGDLFAALAQHLGPRIVPEPRAGRDEPADNDVFLETAEVVGLATDRGLRQHPGGLLEGGRRDEAVGRQRRLGDAQQDRLGRRRRLPGGRRLVVLLLEDELVHELAHHEVGAADLLDAHAPQHLAHDDLDVLIVDGHALQTINFLHLVHEIALKLAIAEDGQVVVRIRRAVHQRLARLDPVAFVDRDVLAARDQVLLGLPIVGTDDDLAHALDEAGELNRAVDLGDDCLLLRLACLEQLGHPRQTAGDVLRLGRLARDLRDDVGLVHLHAVGAEQVGTHRQHVASPRLSGRLAVRRVVPAARRLDRHPGLKLALLVLDDHAPGEAGDLVELLPDRDSVHYVAVRDGAGDLGQDWRGERIPLHEQDTCFRDEVFVPKLDPRPCYHGIALFLATPLVMNDDLAISIEHDDVVIPVFDPANIVVPDFAGVLRVVPRGLDHAARGAADVEPAHRQLGARLADGLGGDDADSLAELREAAGAEVASVAHHADAALRLARERRADTHPLEARVLDLL